MAVLPVGFHEPSAENLSGWSERTVTLQSITTIDLPLSQALKPQQLNDQWSKTVHGASHGSSKERANGYVQPSCDYSPGTKHEAILSQLVHKEFDNLLYGEKQEHFVSRHRDTSRNKMRHRQTI